MNTQETYSLWTNSQKNRFFLIPKTEEIPTGDVLLFAHDGGEKNVDLTAISAFEISEKEAQLYFQQEMEKILQKAKYALTNLITITARQKAQNSPSETQQNYPSGAKFIADLIGVTPQEVLSDPETAKIKFRQVVSQGIQDIIQGSLTEDPQKQARSTQQMRQLKTILQTQGFEISDDMIEKFPEQLRARLHNSDSDSMLQEIISKLQTFVNS